MSSRTDSSIQISDLVQMKLFGNDQPPAKPKRVGHIIIGQSPFRSQKTTRIENLRVLVLDGIARHGPGPRAL